MCGSYRLSRQHFAYAVRVFSVGRNTQKNSFLLNSGNRSFVYTNGTFKLRLGLDETG